MEAERVILKEFLDCPLEDGGEILRRFADLPGAVLRQGAHPLERFVYVPGARKDRVLLIAHCDTVWDQNYRRISSRQILCEENGVLHGTFDGLGIGADDRAGCAMLWLLRNSGHSLLILDGEEHGHFGANYLVREHKKLLRELNAHRYLLQLDLWGGRSCLYHGIPNRRRFCEMIEAWGFCEEHKKNGTDISYLAKSACGANLSVGYHRFHRADEFLSLAEFEGVLAVLRTELEKPQKRYRTRRTVRLYRFARRTASRVYHLFR